MDRGGIFAGDDPFVLAQSWLDEATVSEPNDPSAIALATVDAQGLPNVRMVLLKHIESLGNGEGNFVFYTNYASQKGQELARSGQCAFVLHWKSLRRQIRVRGSVVREEGPQADAYFASRDLKSRIGAWASRQSEPLSSRAALLERAAQKTLSLGLNPPRPPFWGGFSIRPVEIEFWADGAFRLHDRFRWHRSGGGQGQETGPETGQGAAPWTITRLYP